MKKGIHFLFGVKDGVTDFPAVIDRFATLDFDCVELPPEPFLEGDAAKHIVSYAAERGVEIVFSCGFTAEHDMASDDPEVRQNGARYMERVLSVMDGAGIHLLCGTCQTKWPTLRTTPLSAEEKRGITARTAEVFAKAVSTIGDRGIEIAIEPLNRFEGFLINTAAEGVAFCEMLDNDNVGLMLDNFHLSMEEDSFTGAVHTAGKRLKHLHLAENNRRLPGMGEFPWECRLHRATGHRILYDPWRRHRRLRGAVARLHRRAGGAAAVQCAGLPAGKRAYILLTLRPLCAIMCKNPRMVRVCAISPL